MADLITCPRCAGKGYVTYPARKGTAPCPKCHSCGKIEGTFNLPTDVVRYFEQSARFRPETLWNDLWGSPQRTPVPNTAQELAALRDQVKALGERLDGLETAQLIPAAAPAISSEPWESQNPGVAATEVPALQAAIDKAEAGVVGRPGQILAEAHYALTSAGIGKDLLAQRIKVLVAERNRFKALSAARLVDLDVCTARLDSAVADRAATENALGQAISERDEARKAFDDAYASLGQAIAERDEAREGRDNATDALDRIWDIFPVDDDAADVENDDDISHEPLIRRARMVADKLTAARAEVRGLHAALDQSWAR